jgi:hypothetical protein
MSSHDEHDTDRRALIATAIAAGAALPTLALGAAPPGVAPAVRSGEPDPVPWRALPGNHRELLLDKVRRLDHAISALGGAHYGQQMEAFIHAPGWTTLPQFQMVSHSLDERMSQIAAVHSQLDGLLRAMAAISAGGER